MALATAIILFMVSTGVIALAGTHLAKKADQLADITGMGEAIFGAILLGSITSLPGIITSVVAAYNNHPGLAVSNAIGGITAQTVFLCIADIAHPKVNLEHAAASFPNLMQGVLLIGLLATVLIGMSTPEITLISIHPVSIVIVIAYIAGTKLISQAKIKPMWTPRYTHETIQDVPDDKNIKNKRPQLVIAKFVVFAILVAVAGYTVAISGISIAKKTGLSESFIGVLFTAVATSLPELIVAISSVRQKALTLAVGTIIGGNTFDVLFIAFADGAYRKGSILHAITNSQFFIITLTILMTSVLLLGLLHREKRGIGKIGWESFGIILLYLFGTAFLYFMK